jgi:hypothetical protein
MPKPILPWTAFPPNPSLLKDPATSRHRFRNAQPTDATARAGEMLADMFTSTVVEHTHWQPLHPYQILALSHAFPDALLWAVHDIAGSTPPQTVFTITVAAPMLSPRLPNRHGALPAPPFFVLPQDVHVRAGLTTALAASMITVDALMPSQRRQREHKKKKPWLRHHASCSHVNSRLSLFFRFVSRGVISSKFIAHQHT